MTATPSRTKIVSQMLVTIMPMSTEMMVMADENICGTDWLSIFWSVSVSFVKWLMRSPWVLVSK